MTRLHQLATSTTRSNSLDLQVCRDIDLSKKIDYSLTSFSLRSILKFDIYSVTLGWLRSLCRTRSFRSLSCCTFRKSSLANHFDHSSPPVVVFQSRVLLYRYYLGDTVYTIQFSHLNASSSLLYSVD